MEPDASGSSTAQQDAPKPASDDTSTQKVFRKRTKTGCLTCRQRRIKCGEEKPVCKNCIKSRRECKGYAQRLVFKNPLGLPGISNFPQILHPLPAQTIPLHRSYDGTVTSLGQPGGSQKPILAPRPMALPVSEYNHTVSAVSSMPQGDQQLPYADEEHIVPPSAAGHPVGPSIFPMSLPLQPQDMTSNSTSHYMQHQITGHPIQRHHSYSQESNQITASSHLPSFFQDYTSRHVQLPTASTVPQTLSPRWTPNPSDLQGGQQILQEYIPRRHSESSSQMVYEEDGDDYDVGSDEELEDQISTQNFNQLSLIMASANGDERQLRSFTMYLNEPNVLASYRPSLGSSPLNNPKTARIFLHFIHSAGPSLSIFERHPIDPSTMFGAPVPAAQQGLWTYTLPFKALEHQELLQAILALSSLHISLLQQVPPTVSMKHYHFALKKVGAAVGLPTRRKHIGTLAATLILGYYEVMAADPSKWNNHIAGSAQLVREIDFAGTTRDLRAHRRRVWAQRQEMGGSEFPLNDIYPFANAYSDDDPFAEKESSIDEGIIGTLIGRAVNYDDFGNVDDDYAGSYKRHFTRKDVENFRVQCDLYWWYFKQDTMQSMLTGNALFLPYSQWGQCPPRAGLGRLDAIYGSADHLWLLLARLTDFGHRDRKRKLKAIAKMGSSWKPGPELGRYMARFASKPPGGQTSFQSAKTSNTSADFSEGLAGAFAHGPESARPGPWSGGGSEKSVSGTTTTETRQSHNTDNGSPPGGPPMYGMVPTGRPRCLPLAFTDAATRANSPGQDDEYLENVSYSEAEQEWESILAAFEMLARTLGPYFEPLPSDSAPPIATVFGPALQFRTHTIAVIWGFYYLGRILMQRLHPSMPPAMMVAAGVAAPVTADYSQIVGRIVGGIYYPQLFNLEAERLSPTLGSCLIEITVPIFFAAVQFTNPVQRRWMADTLSEVSRLTGWKTSDAIRSGCESAWRAAAKQGRGPPYHPPEGDIPHRPSAWMSAVESRASNNRDRRFVKVKAPYVDFPMGILSLDADMVRLGINDQA
ncbi:hypothetical protein BDV25DRAFT_142744 [Aspergillus avenaceus]|uniref:Zn(2)-C6 fungal-type domain-containing protein n=1 Tax=Aspergillus avenaceus TaxID=36643 RepID=A0A5N6TM76_ASPAV|nr:hypothetical protein BDV25DRAFT_142744 [Aspergillus avenaceus]